MHGGFERSWSSLSSEKQDARLIIQHRLRIPLSDDTHHLSISGDGSSVAIVAGSLIRIFVNEQEVASWQCPENVSDLSLSADGKRLAVINHSPNIAVHDSRTGQTLSTLDRNGAPNFLQSDNQVHAAIYPDAKSLVSTGSKQRLYVSDIATGRWQYIMFMKHRGARCGVSPTGKHVVLIGTPNPSELAGQVSVFAVNHGLQPLWNKSHTTEDAVTWAVFRDDGEQLATGASDGVRIWNTSDGTAVQHLSTNENTPSVGACFVRHSEILMANSSELTLVDLTNGKTIETTKCSDEITECGSSFNGNTIVTRSQNAINYWTIKPNESGDKR